VVNDGCGCHVAEGQNYIATAADCASAAAVVLGWTPQQVQGIRVISKASKLPGCYWRPSHEDLTFNAAGDTDALWPGTNKHSICNDDPTNPGGNDVAPFPE